MTVLSNALPITAHLPSPHKRAILHTQIGFNNGGAALNLTGCTLRKGLTKVEYMYSVAHTHNQIHMMLDDKHRQIELVAD